MHMCTAFSKVILIQQQLQIRSCASVKTDNFAQTVENMHIKFLDFHVKRGKLIHVHQPYG